MATTGSTTTRASMMTNAAQTDLTSRLNTLEGKMDALSLQVATQFATISGQITSRSEIAAEDNKRVSMERYEGAMSGVHERLARLENGPQKLLGWIALIVSGSVGCLSLVVMVISILVTISIAWATHTH